MWGGTMEKHRNSYLDSPIKQEHREILKGILMKKKGNKKVLTMSGLIGKDAKMYASQNSVVFSIERDKEVFHKQVEELRQYPVVSLNTSMLDFIKSDFVEKVLFDLVYLDYCGPYTRNTEDTLKEVFKKKIISQEGHLAITLALSRDGYQSILSNTDLLNLTCCGDTRYYLENRVKVITATIKSIAKEHHITLLEKHRREYKNPGSKMEMLFLVYSL